jgi:hypothetical protein
LLDEPIDRSLAMLNDISSGRFIAQTRARYHGVPHVRCDRILVRQHSRDSALRPATGSIEQGFFGDYPDLLMFGELKGQCQSRQTAANDEGVKF